MDDIPEMFVAISAYDIKKVEYYETTVMDESNDIATILAMPEDFPFVELNKNIHIPNIIYVSKTSPCFAADVIFSDNKVIYFCD